MSSAVELNNTESAGLIDFQADPSAYRHWSVGITGAVATVGMNVDEQGGLVPGYELKLNSYDLGVDIELHDIVQRLRFEHPEVRAVVITSLKPRVFCAGANIRMLGQSSHQHKVNFCKFTNETRNAIEDATAHSGQTYLCAVNGPCAGGGYELALACDQILLIDDGSTTVSLPELPLLGVLPGTGGLTRLVDKRGVRRDRADFFCTTEEGIRGQRAVDWNLVDELAPASAFDDKVLALANQAAASSDRPTDAEGIRFTPLKRRFGTDEITYDHVRIDIDRDLRAATITIEIPDDTPASVPDLHAAGDQSWPLKLARELDDVILHLRTNESDIGTWLFKSIGGLDAVQAMDRLLDDSDDWLVRELRLYWKRILSRLDVTSRSLLVAIEPGSCFIGTLFEIALACDQIFMLDGEYEGNPAPPPVVALSNLNFGAYPTVTGLSRLEARFWQNDGYAGMEALRGLPLEAAAADDAGLVTFIPDDIDWDDEIRLALESRASFSPDALIGMEANLRFAGPETMTSKIFSRLSAWQNWIFQRPNAVGENGALVKYGTGSRPEFNKQRV